MRRVAEPLPVILAGKRVDSIAEDIQGEQDAIVMIIPRSSPTVNSVLQSAPHKATSRRWLALSRYRTPLSRSATAIHTMRSCVTLTYVSSGECVQVQRWGVLGVDGLRTVGVSILPIRLYRANAY